MFFCVLLESEQSEENYAENSNVLHEDIGLESTGIIYPIYLICFLFFLIINL